MSCEVAHNQSANVHVEQLLLLLPHSAYLLFLLLRNRTPTNWALLLLRQVVRDHLAKFANVLLPLDKPVVIDAHKMVPVEALVKAREVPALREGLSLSICKFVKTNSTPPSHLIN